MEPQRRVPASSARDAASHGAAPAVRAQEGGRPAALVQAIRALIGENGLRPGDRLPSERQLATRFGSSRGSVRQAIQYLTIMGLIEVRHGGGSFLRADPEAIDGNPDGWRRWVLDHRGRVLEALEVRLGAESFAAGLAAQRASPDDIERLVLALQSMREVCAAGDFDTAAFIETDLAFHDALLQASRNKILRDLIRALGEELLPERAAVTSLQGRVEKTFEEHRAIYEAVRSGDVDGAAEAMRQHIMSVRRDVLVRVLEDGRLQTVRRAQSSGKRAEDAREP